MLRELTIENLALIERVHLRLADGLNVFTGETGAGKTMLAGAIDLLLGGKAKKGLVRPGAGEVYVEGIFDLPEGLFDSGDLGDLRERLPEDLGDEIVLARKVTPDGRTRAFVGGRSATVADLRVLGSALITFFGQHEHRKLTVAGAQLQMLDAFCGGAQLALVAEGQTAHSEVARLKSRLRELDEIRGGHERELGLLEFELTEIEELDPAVADEQQLQEERDRLRSVDVLRLATATALAAIDGADETAAGATGALAAATAGLIAADGADRQLDALAARLSSLSIELEDTATELRSFTETIAADPGRLAEIEERLDQYDRLKRKHGGTVDLVLAHAERCRTERVRIAGAHDDAERVQADLEQARAVRDELFRKLSSARLKAAPGLADAVMAELDDLAMEGARFEVEVSVATGAHGATGTDAVEFMIAPNAGLPLTPLRETASGGELSRTMLALLTVTRASSGEALVFDEIDAGIGGQTARAVGDKLRSLSLARQVLCITHLPQVASLGNRHFQIDKAQAAGEARTEVRELVAVQIVDELCRMLGADADDGGAREHAERLLAAAT